MKFSEAAAVFTAWGAWRITGLAFAGRILARKLASQDETCRTAAGMLLVRSGARALSVLQQNLIHYESRALTLRVLGSIGAREAASAIEPYLGDPDPVVARAAADAMAAIERDGK